MPKLTFFCELKEHTISDDYEKALNHTIRDFIKNHDDANNSLIRLITDNQKKIVIKVKYGFDDYICKNDQIDWKFADFNIKMTYFPYIHVRIDSWDTRREEITDDEINEPVIQYLIKNEIDRGCWTWIRDGFCECIDIKKPFINYINENKLEFFSNIQHVKHCSGVNCDLIDMSLSPSDRSTYRNECFVPMKINQRTSEYKIWVQTNDLNNGEYTILLRLPVICDSGTIMRLIFQHIKSNQYNKNHLKFIDHSLYYVKRKYLEKEDDVFDFLIKCDAVGDHILDYFCKNGHWIPSDISLVRLVFAHRLIISDDFNKLIDIPSSLSDIIYEYADFDCVSVLVYYQTI